MKSSGGVARPRVKGVSRHVRENTELWGDAVAEFEAGNFSRAADIFTRMDFTTAQVTFNAGTAHMALGEYEEAIELYTDTLKRDPYLVMAYYQRAQAFHLYGWHEDALRDLSEAQTRMRGSKFIDYTNLGMKHVLWECMIYVNLAVTYFVLGLKRHAVQQIEMAKTSRRESLASRRLHGISEQDIDVEIEAMLPMSILNDIHSYCKDSERHQAGTCAYLAFQPMTIFKPRGLASLWLHASKRAKKDYLGKSQMIFNKTSLKGTGFQGAEAKAEGKPLPLKPDPPANGTTLHNKVLQTLNRGGGIYAIGRSQSQSCSQPTSTRGSETKMQLRGMRSRSFPPTTVEKVRPPAPPRPASSKLSLTEGLDQPYENCLVTSPADKTQASSTRDVRPTHNPPKMPSSVRGRSASKPSSNSVVKAVSPDSGIELEKLILPQIIAESKCGEDLYQNISVVDEQQHEDDQASEAAALVSLNLLSEQLAKGNSRENAEVLLKAISDVTEHLQDGATSTSVPPEAVELLDEESKSIYQNMSMTRNGTLNEVHSHTPSGERSQTLQSTTSIDTRSITPTVPKSLYNTNSKLPAPQEDVEMERFCQMGAAEEAVYDDVAMDSTTLPRRRRLSSAFSILNKAERSEVGGAKQAHLADVKAPQRPRAPPTSVYQNVKPLVLPNPSTIHGKQSNRRTPKRPQPPATCPKPAVAKKPIPKKPPIPKRPTDVTGKTLSSIGNPVIPGRPLCPPKPASKPTRKLMRQAPACESSDSDTSSGYCRSTTSNSHLDNDDRSRMNSSSSCSSAFGLVTLPKTRPRPVSISSPSSQEDHEEDSGTGTYESIFIDNKSPAGRKTQVFDDPRYGEVGLGMPRPEPIGKPSGGGVCVAKRTRPAGPRQTSSCVQQRHIAAGKVAVTVS